MKNEFRIYRAPYGRGYELHFANIGTGDSIAFVEPITLRMRQEGDGAPPPMMSNLDEPSLQSLMDELWNVGIRPRDIGTAGHLAATQAHLADVRALVSKAYDVKL